MMFFFFKQKTAYEMRISDWSSDVCSSDLPTGPGKDTHRRSECGSGRPEIPTHQVYDGSISFVSGLRHWEARVAAAGRIWLRGAVLTPPKLQIGRASCRERVCPYV